MDNCRLVALGRLLWIIGQTLTSHSLRTRWILRKTPRGQPPWSPWDPPFRTSLQIFPQAPLCVEGWQLAGKDKGLLVLSQFYRFYQAQQWVSCQSYWLGLLVPRRAWYLNQRDTQSKSTCFPKCRNRLISILARFT